MGIRNRTPVSFVKKVLRKAISGAHLFYESAIHPRSKNEDDARREFILNILLLTLILASSVAFVLTWQNWARLGPENYQGISPPVIAILVLLFMGLFWMSRRGSFVVSAYIFIGVFLTPVIIALLVWGVDLPQGLLLLALVIGMSGILIGTRFLFTLSLLIFVFLLVIGTLQSKNILPVINTWKTEHLVMSDIIAAVVTLGSIQVVSWLANREIEKSLRRAWASEAELKQERDLLEVKVEARTRELQKAQLEQVSQLYRFAEFGRLASGLFHDLVNPLNALGVNLELLQSSPTKSVKAVRTQLDQAMKTTKRMEAFIHAVKKQIQQQETASDFNIADEVDQACEVLAYRARKDQVSLIHAIDPKLMWYGNPIKFNQVITNLLANAIDACDDPSLPVQRRRVSVKVERLDDGSLHVVIEDMGMGIPAEIQQKIFEPFFTTKSAGKGTGIGLSTVKHIVESDFGGTIHVQSSGKDGARFIVTLPARERERHDE